MRLTTIPIHEPSASFTHFFAFIKLVALSNDDEHDPYLCCKLICLSLELARPSSLALRLSVKLKEPHKGDALK